MDDSWLPHAGAIGSFPSLFYQAESCWKRIRYPTQAHADRMLSGEAQSPVAMGTLVPGSVFLQHSMQCS